MNYGKLVSAPPCNLFSVGQNVGKFREIVLYNCSNSPKISQSSANSRNHVYQKYVWVYACTSKSILIFRFCVLIIKMLKENADSLCLV